MLKLQNNEVSNSSKTHQSKADCLTIAGCKGKLLALQQHRHSNLIKHYLRQSEV
ncbi:hypothetical protein PPIS_a2896 [Pseudoalteromonas piscicida]|uniref:Uncharacterized protein n=1 Tax=Pseudoalteromonas piscicida TaxID=43662 RepID=A0ABM6NG40_PSEO7|nr:hypothetical protein PPIS_a2896 [Pseudoalteromonas piscicida]